MDSPCPLKQENSDFIESEKRNNNLTCNTSPIGISSSSSSSSSSGDDLDTGNEFWVQLRSNLEKKRGSSDFQDSSLLAKKPRTSGSVLPFLSKNSIQAPMPLSFVPPPPQTEPVVVSESPQPIARSCKQFWKAGDYDGGNAGDSSSSCYVGMDHLRVHPKFLHSNATSHKWALGAFAELLDNSLDEVCNGATYVCVDMLKNKKDGSHMLLVEDDGGGMTPDKMRQCMSLGYSVKSKMSNTIGQYGNGFKTSTMRLGADVIVFSCCKGNDGQSATQSIGLLSYTFLRGTGKEDIVVPMIDYEKKGRSWNKLMRSSCDDWNRNLETIVHWSPYKNEKELVQQFDSLKNQGTRIIIYNLWEDDEGNLELDFDSDKKDIQIRGVNRDEKNIEMAQRYTNCIHFLTYRHSLRIYASILYLRLPPGFRIILRGKDVEHHNIVNDMMLTKELKYKPLHLSDGVLNSNMVATVTIGFVKDARYHIDVQGFNIYHKNRLIKPFWRLWNAAGSDGRGIIGVLEANFVEPAHDKQSFERTPVLSRLENRLVKFQKQYWGNNCQEVGYAPRRHLKKPVSPKTDSKTSSSKMKSGAKFDMRSPPASDDANQDGSSNEESPAYNEPEQDFLALGRSPNRARTSRSRAAVVIGDGQVLSDGGNARGSSPQTARISRSRAALVDGDGQVISHGETESLNEPKVENLEKRRRPNKNGGPTKDDILNDLQYERDRCRSLEDQLREVQMELEKAQQKAEESNQEQLALIDILQEERERQDGLEESMRERLREASDTISELVEKVKQLEGKGK
ncbi:hypothetical protein ACOSP7_018769 [Xanthoceras sorbifolium]